MTGQSLLVARSFIIDIFDRYKIAQPASRAAARHPAAGLFQNIDDLCVAQAADRGLVAEGFFKAEARAAVGQGIAVDIAAAHFKVDDLIAAHAGVVDPLVVDAAFCLPDHFDSGASQSRVWPAAAFNRSRRPRQTRGPKELEMCAAFILSYFAERFPRT